MATVICRTSKKRKRNLAEGAAATASISCGKHTARLANPKEKLSRLVEKGAQIFDEYVQKKISEAGADSEVVQELEKISKRVPIYVNSATPVDALKRTILNLGISRLFQRRARQAEF